MRRFILIGLGFLTFSRLLAQEQSRVLPEFTQVVSKSNAKIELIQADRNSIYIDGPADAVKSTEANVHGNTLVIGTVGGDKESTVIRVYFKTLNSLALDGSSEAYTSAQITSPQFSLVLDGAAKADLDVKTPMLTGKSDGAAATTLKGEVSRFSWSADGASDLNASALITDTAAMITDGAARASINVKKAVNIKASGISSITFEGGAPSRSISVSGTANVSDKEGKQDFSENPLDNKSDTTRVKIGTKRFIIIDDEDTADNAGKKKEKKVRMKRVWSGFELGLNSFMTPDMNFTMKKNYEFLEVKYQNSWFFGLNLLEANGHIIRNKLALTTGLGMEFVNFNFEKNDVLVPDTNVLIAANPSGRSYSTNRLYNFNLNAPFLLKFAPNPKSFHIAVGVIVNFVAVSHVKTISTSMGYEEENIIRDDFNINPFRATATVRVGYGRVKLFANYGLTPYFNSSKAPDVRTFAAGLTLIGF